MTSASTSSTDPAASSTPDPPEDRPDPVAGLPDGYVVIGRIGRPQGIKGEVTVEVRTDDPDGRFAVGVLLLRADGGPPLEVLGTHWHGGRLLLTLAGVHTRNDAELLRDTLLVADRSLDPPLEDEDEFYDLDLVGLRAELADGSLLGAVSSVVHLPGSDLLAIDRPDGTELLVPFVRAVVPVVDVRGGRVVVEPPDGLLAL